MSAASIEWKPLPAPADSALPLTFALVSGKALAAGAFRSTPARCFPSMKMHILFRTVGIATCFARLAAIAAAAEPAAAPLKPIPIAELRRTVPVNFETEILPIFRQNCLACHKSLDPESGLVLETPDAIRKGGEHGPAVVSGHAAESHLLQLASHQQGPEMPPADNKVAAAALTPEQLGLIQAWINQGAQGSVGTIARTIPRGPLPAAAHPILALAITPDDSYVACGRGNKLAVYDLRVPRLDGELVDPALASAGFPGAAHEDLIRSLAFDRQGDFLASGGFRTVKLWRRPRASAQPDIASQEPARCVAVSPDGQLLALGTAVGTIELHDLAGKQPVKVLAKHDAAVTGLAFAADGSRLYSAGLDKTVRAWDVSSGAAAGKQTTPAEVRALCLLPGGNQVATGEADGVVRIWNTAAFLIVPKAATPQPLARELKGHAKAVIAIALLSSPKGARLVSGSEDGHLRIWDLASGNTIGDLDHGGPVTAVAASPDGRRCASAGANGVARLWNPDGGAMLAELKDDPRAAQTVARAEAAVDYAKACIEYRKEELRDAEEKAKRESTALDDAKKAKTADEKAVADKTGPAEKALAAVKAAEAKAAEAEAALKALADKKPDDPAVQKAKQSLEQARQAAARAAEQAQQPKRELEEAKNTLAGRVSFIATATLVAERAKAAIPTAQEAIKKAEATAAQREAEKVKLVESSKSGQKPLTAIAFSRDNRLLAVAGQSSAVRLYDASQGTASEVLDRSGDAVGNGLRAVPAAGLVCIAVASDGRIYAAAEKTVLVWKTTSSWPLERTIGHVDNPAELVDRVLALDFSPDGKLLATGGGLAARSGELKLWSVETGRLVREIPLAHRDTIYGVRFSPDGQYLATGSADRLLKIFRVADPSAPGLVRTFEGHTAAVLGVAWSADGKLLATCGGDRVVKIWNVESGTPLRTLRGDTYQLGDYKGEVTSIAFVGDTEHLLASAGDHTVRLHRTSSDRDVRAFREGASFMHAAVATSDGRLIIAGGRDGILHIWNGQNGYPVPPFEQPGSP